jgi:hypothetical protein
MTNKVIRIEEEDGQLYKVEMVESREPINRQLVEEQYKEISKQYLSNEEELNAIHDKQCENVDKMLLIEKFVPEEMKLTLSEEYIDTEQGLFIEKSIIDQHLPVEINVDLEEEQTPEE